MTLLDLFCGAGGAAMGYHRAGFDRIVGVDNVYQKRYPFEFVQADALEFLAAHGREFDVIHASPPCQGYSRCRFLPQNADKRYPKLIEPIRRLLRSIDATYIIENVEYAPLENFIMLSGLHFGMHIIRRRKFEIWPHYMLEPVPHKKPNRKCVADISEFDRGQYGFISVYGDRFSVPVAQKAMGIDWMTRKELAQAIPPAYTEYIGTQLLRILHISPEQTKRDKGAIERPPA